MKKTNTNMFCKQNEADMSFNAIAAIKFLALTAAIAAVMLFNFACTASADGSNTAECIKLVTPVDTVVLSSVIKLKWVDTCGPAKYNVRVSINSEVIYEKLEYKNSDITSLLNEIELPAETITEGCSINWLVDAGEHGIESATFTVLDSSRKEAILDKISALKEKNTIEDRLELIDILFMSRLYEDAQREVDLLQNDIIAKSLNH